MKILERGFFLGYFIFLMFTLEMYCNILYNKRNITFWEGSRLEKIFLVANPRSGMMKLKNHLLSIVEVFSKANFSVTVYPTKCRGDATQVVSRLSDEYTTIVCCGGDGTLNEVIAGIMKNEHHYRLGYIPAGTLNEWSSGLKISRDMVKAAEDIVNGRLIPLDIGLFDERFFTYTASFGAFTDASYSAPQEMKNVFGQAAYIVEGIKSIGNIKPIKMSFKHDGGEITGDFLFGSVSNSMSLGGIIKLDETVVELNDGKFEVLLIRNPENLSQFNNIVSSILKKDLSNPSIEFFRTEKLSVDAPRNIPWTLDGEQGFPQHNKFVIQNVHSAISFYVPDIK